MVKQSESDENTQLQFEVFIQKTKETTIVNVTVTNSNALRFVMFVIYLVSTASYLNGPFIVPIKLLSVENSSIYLPIANLAKLLHLNLVLIFIFALFKEHFTLSQLYLSLP